MSTPLTHLETTSRVIKRAQYEAFEFTIDVGGILVRNASHANPDEHEYVVTVEDGLPTECECPADTKYDGACKHRVAVAIRRPILDAAVDRQLAADGGPSLSRDRSERGNSEVRRRDPPSKGSPVESSPSEANDRDHTDEKDCECDGLPGQFPCWECVRTGRRSIPNGDA